MKPKNKIRFYVLLFLMGGIAYSYLSPKLLQPGLSCTYDNFVIIPRIIKEEDKYFLEYKVNILNTDSLTRWFVYSKIQEDQLVFLASSKLSYQEYKDIVKRPIVDSTSIKYCNENKVFWLNEDGNVSKLVIDEQ